MKRQEETKPERQERVLARVLAEELKAASGAGVRISGPATGNLNGSDITDDGPNDRANAV